MTKESKQPIVDWEPAPGCVLVKPLKRDELRALYNRPGGKHLEFADNVGKVSDSVGVGRVIKKGAPLNDKLRLDLLKLNISGTITKEEMETEFALNTAQIEIGDFVAFMPYTDHLIEIDGVKYSLIGYDKIRATRKASK